MLRELKEIEEKIESFRAKNNREIDSFRVKVIEDFKVD